MSIHPTALVDPLAALGEEVVIGPFAVVEAGARIGDRCVIDAHAHIVGSVELGENCRVGHHAVLGGDPQDLSFDPATSSSVQIGPSNVFREHVTIHRSSQPGGATLIGRQNYLMAGSHVGHDSILGNKNILANHCLLGGHVQLGNGAFLGGGCAVHQFVRIGSLCMIKGLAAISQDVPPFVLVSGSNCVHGLNVVGMKRAGFTPDTRKNIKIAFRHIFLANLNLEAALAATLLHEWTPEALEFLNFFRVPTQRGVCRPG